MSNRRRAHQPNSPRPRTLEEAALSVVRTLQEAEHIAFFAGGCVRDRIMGVEPKDFDVATSALPEEVMGLFNRTQKVGAKFGVVLVRRGRFSIEVATFRNDLDYEDGRRPVGVEFSSPEEDAQRRDFTINGMFYDPIEDTIVDYVGGRADIDAKVVRAIGDPERRFAEDHLRLLRAVRFAARLGFRIEARTWDAVRHHAPELERISPERIRMELEAILPNAHRDHGLKLLADAGLISHLWPSAAALREPMVSALGVVEHLPSDAGFELVLGALLHACGPEAVEAALTDLRCSNFTMATVRWLVDTQDAMADPSQLTLADLKLLMHHDAFNDLLALFRARLSSMNESLAAYEEISERVRRIPEDEIKPAPFVGGSELAKLGIPEGPVYGMIIKRVYYAQLNGEVRDRAAAVAMAEKLSAALE